MKTLDLTQPYEICICTKEISNDDSNGTTVFSIIGGLHMIMVGHKYILQKRKGYGFTIFEIDKSLIGIISNGLYINHFDKLSDVREDKLNKILN